MAAALAYAFPIAGAVALASLAHSARRLPAIYRDLCDAAALFSKD